MILEQIDHTDPSIAYDDCFVDCDLHLEWVQVRGSQFRVVTDGKKLSWLLWDSVEKEWVNFSRGPAWCRDCLHFWLPKKFFIGKK